MGKTMISSYTISDIECIFPFFSKKQDCDILLPAKVTISFEPFDYRTFQCPKDSEIVQSIKTHLIDGDNNFDELMAGICMQYESLASFMAISFIFEGYPITLSFEFRKGVIKKSTISLSVRASLYEVSLKVNFNDLVLFEDLIQVVSEAIYSFRGGDNYYKIAEILSRSLPMLSGIKWYRVTLKTDRNFSLVSERKVKAHD